MLQDKTNTEVNCIKPSAFFSLGVKSLALFLLGSGLMFSTSTQAKSHFELTSNIGKGMEEFIVKNVKNGIFIDTVTYSYHILENWAYGISGTYYFALVENPSLQMYLGAGATLQMYSDYKSDFLVKSIPKTENSAAYLSLKLAYHGLDEDIGEEEPTFGFYLKTDYGFSKKDSKSIRTQILDGESSISYLKVAFGVSIARKISNLGVVRSGIEPYVTLFNSELNYGVGITASF